MKTRSKCEVCLGRKKTRKHIPYGSVLNSRSWCSCDRNQVDEVNKKRERSKGKKQCKELT